jgi:hypothetical protein
MTPPLFGEARESADWTVPGCLLTVPGITRSVTVRLSIASRMALFPCLLLWVTATLTPSRRFVSSEPIIRI